MMTTNRCKKHEIAYVEDECPECARETYANNLEATNHFFHEHGQDTIQMRKAAPELQKFELTRISIEDLYQHFRMRLIDELNPPEE